MPRYLAIGVSKSEFMDSNPVELAPYIKAHKIKLEEIDRMLWMACGNYVRSAFEVAIDHCMNGRKATSKYIEKPIFETVNTENNLTEEEIKRQRELFVAKLMVMKTNFELNKKS